MDRNSLIGFILIGVVIFAFSWLNRPTPEQIEARKQLQDSLARVEALHLQAEKEIGTTTKEVLPATEADSATLSRMQEAYGVFAAAAVGNEETTTLENDLVELKFSNKGGRVISARLKNYVTSDSLPLYLFEKNGADFNLTLTTASNRVLNTSDLYFTPINKTANSITFRLDAGNGRYLDYMYTVPVDDYMIEFKIKGNGMGEVLAAGTNTLDLQWNQKIRQQEHGRKFEERYTGIFYKNTADDVENLSESRDDSKTLQNKVKWVAYKDQFFSTALISDDSFENAKMSSSIYKDGEFLKNCSLTASVPFDVRGNQQANFRYYFGPNKFSLLQAYDDDATADNKLQLDKLVPLGMSVFRWVNQYFVIPIFNFFGNFINNYGIIIFLLTLVVKIFLFPLTYKSYMSSAKMRVLRPQIEEINAKLPGQDNAMARQRATMELYSKAGVSPMSGCLPMLLQMPILLALFAFFPSAIELRQESFLWAHDLSTYDAIVSWNTYIPIITPYFGNHISLFCLLMTITNVIYTKFNMEQTNTGQQQMPGMKVMMYMMPLMFLVFFNQYASGLSYYYFISTLITIIQTLIFRYTINEDKLLAKLEANKRKPRKKSGFMARLEEAQRLQQEAQKRKNGGR
ncbi:MAG: membrane protein insertase YidC [Tannerellaceae bacterium]